MKLVIGAGNRRLEGYKHHDVQDLEGLDYVCDFWDLPKRVKAGSCEEIQMTHVLEHFPMSKTLDALKLVNKLLKKSGKLYIEVPNFYWHAQEILANPRNRKIVEYAYGGQKDEWDFHYNGFTPEILWQDLTRAGFEVGMLVPNSSIEVWSEKL